MKKAIAIILLVCMAVLCVGCTSAGANGDTAIAESELHPNEEMKIGKYFREGGTDEQYVEIYEGFQVQLFGFDLYQRTVDLNKDLLESLTDEEREATLKELKADADWRESRLYYQINPLSGNLVFKDTPEYIDGLGGAVLMVVDENTLKFDKDEIYIYEKAE